MTGEDSRKERNDGRSVRLAADDVTGKHGEGNLDRYLRTSGITGSGHNSREGLASGRCAALVEHGAEPGMQITNQRPFLLPRIICGHRNSFPQGVEEDNVTAGSSRLKAP